MEGEGKKNPCYLKEQNKTLLESLERHLEEKAVLRKQLYKDTQHEFSPNNLPQR